VQQTFCGSIVLAGRPNAGKSTLLNTLVESPLAIVSPKAQTTRMPVIGIRTEPAHQFAFIDPPGLLEPAYLLQAGMVLAAGDLVRTADAVLYLHPLADAPAPDLAALLPAGVRPGGPVQLVYSQADRAPAADRERRDGAIVVSAPTGAGIAELLDWCRAHIPAGPFGYDPEALSTQPERFFVTEFVREAAFTHLGDELPYALAVEVDEFREGSTPLYIRLTLFVERPSQQGMVIGRGGRTIKAIGQDARVRTEAFLAQPVFLDLWVKTLPKWRSDPIALRRFGVPVPPQPTRTA
jgi:GTP-binding protein Era